MILVVRLRSPGWPLRMACGSLPDAWGRHAAYCLPARYAGTTLVAALTDALTGMSVKAERYGRNCSEILAATSGRPFYNGFGLTNHTAVIGTRTRDVQRFSTLAENAGKQRTAPMNDIGLRRASGIREIAHRIWEQEGRPEGQHDRHWEMAKEALAAEKERAGERGYESFRQHAERRQRHLKGMFWAVGVSPA